MGTSTGAGRPAGSWGSDLRRILLIGVFVSLFMTVLVAMAAGGLLRTNNMNVVTADGVWAGICAMGCGLLFPVLLASRERRDAGFRREGLVSLLLVGIPAASAIEVLAMMSWPFLLGDATPGTVAAELTTDPASTGLAFVLLVAATSWFTDIVLAMVTGGWRLFMGWTRLVLMGGPLILLYLAAVFLFMFAAVDVFEGPPSTAKLLALGVIALGGFVVLVCIGVLRTIIDRA